MKKVLNGINKITTLLGFVLILLGVVFYVYHQMNPKNPANQPAQTGENKIPVATNNKPLATPSPKDINYSANFAIFTNGTFRIFTASMYHNQNPDVFIQSPSPNTVQVKKNGLTWQVFFDTLPFKMSKECLTTGTGDTFCSGKNGSLRFFLNGEENSNALSSAILENDKLLVTFGTLTDLQIENQIERLNSL